MEKALLENVIHPDSMYSFAYFPTYSHHLSKLDLESLWYAKAAHLSYHHYYNNLISILFQSNFTYLVFETNFVHHLKIHISKSIKIHCPQNKVYLRISMAEKINSFCVIYEMAWK